MQSGSANGAVAGNGLKKADAPHTTNPSPPEGVQQQSMLADARTNPCDFLANLIGRRRDDVAYKLYPNLGPVEAVETLNRNLRGKEKRKVGIHEIDVILDVLGREAEEQWFRFCLKRRGIQPPDLFDRYGELERLRAENACLREEVERKDVAIAEMAESFAHAREEVT